ENVKTLSAWSTGRPRIWSATSRPFWAERRTPRKIALVSIISPYFLTTAFFVPAVCPLNVRVRANSPSLWPTMFSEMYTGICCLPLCTAMVRPTKSGRTVERRDQVLIGRLSLVARDVSTFFSRWASTNGPFLTERAMLHLLFLVPALDDHAVRALIAACTVALGRRTPRADRITAGGGLALAAAVRVVD